MFDIIQYTCVIYAQHQHFLYMQLCQYRDEIKPNVGNMPYSWQMTPRVL